MSLSTILHLSDLHLRDAAGEGHYWNQEATELALPDHDRRGLLGSLMADLASLGARPEVAIVTGDLLDRASESGVSPTLRFLEQLAAELGLAPEQVVLTPGNHDLIRDSDLGRRWKLWDEIWTRFYGRPASGAMEAPFRRVHRFDLGGALDLEVVSFNSCEALDEAQERCHGSVGPGQRSLAEKMLRPSAKFRIAAMHHHLSAPAGLVRKDLSVMEDAASLRTWLARNRFQIALHGHQHVDWHDVHLIDDWHLAVVAAASAGVGSYGRRVWDLRLGYQLIAIDDLRRGRRLRREYSPQLREWVAAAGDRDPFVRFGRCSEIESIDFSFAGEPFAAEFTARHDEAVRHHELGAYRDALQTCAKLLREVLAWAVRAQTAEQDGSLPALIGHAVALELLGSLAAKLAHDVGQMEHVGKGGGWYVGSARPSAALSRTAFGALAEVVRSLSARLSRRR